MNKNSNIKFALISLISIFIVTLTYFLPYGFWAEIGDLPAHPLIVHVVVVILPLAAIFLLAGLYKREILQSAHIPAIAVVALSTVAVIAAKSSGDSLSAAVGLPEFHAEWGNNLVPLAMALLVSLIVFSFFTFHKKVRIASVVFGSFMAAAAVGAIGMTYVVGHSGAESVWKEEYAQAKAPIESSGRSISLSEVQSHSVNTDCWTIVGDNVYDVTSFASRHPAGSPAINEMCGKNASDDFLSEHSGQQEPEMWLEKFKIGSLKP